MDIVVCIKAVCMSPVRFEVAQEGYKIDCGSRTLVMNEVDEYALEQALVMKGEFGGSITALSAGGLPSQDILYIAKAKGVDRATRVATEYSDPELVSELLAKAIQRQHFDLILTGVESSDGMYGQTGITLAAKLGLPFAYAVTEINAKVTPGFVRVKKELGSGVYQVMDIKLPALLCVQTGIQPLKYTPPAKIIRARKDPLEVFSVDDAASTMAGKARFTEVFKPEITRKAEIIQGKPAEVAPIVIKKILEVS